jgi:gamma-glutamyl-gamma-aminobutyrate hydrolase PuuD
MAVQSHPERTEFTSPEFERLWAAFVEAAHAYASGSDRQVRGEG